jgi:hypothetical protein
MPIERGPAVAALSSSAPELRRSRTP